MMTKQQINESVGLKVKMARLERKLSQGELAHACNDAFPTILNWSPSDISRIEMGARYLNPWYAYVIATGLDMDMRDLIKEAVAGITR